MEYEACWKLQQELFDATLARKAAHLTSESAGELLLVEHPPVYTLGKSGKSENLLVTEQYLASLGASFFHIDRGGDVTFHGPGQLVGYPILDLEMIGIGLRDYIHCLEEAAIRTVGHYGIEAGRSEGASGVWLDAGTTRMRKICAIGVRSSRFVTMHGLALNASTDLKWFTMINPCGFVDKGVTSITKELGHEVSFEEASQVLCKKLLANFNLERV
jgi:lipoyl(octanoyl) transferase